MYDPRHEHEMIIAANKHYFFERHEKIQRQLKTQRDLLSNLEESLADTKTLTTNLQKQCTRITLKTQNMEQSAKSTIRQHQPLFTIHDRSEKTSDLFDKVISYHRISAEARKMIIAGPQFSSSMANYIEILNELKESLEFLSVNKPGCMEYQMAKDFLVLGKIKLDEDLMALVRQKSQQMDVGMVSQYLNKRYAFEITNNNNTNIRENDESSTLELQHECQYHIAAD